MAEIEPRYVVVTGGYRTGSTVAFNVARLVAEAAGAEDYPHGLRGHDVGPFYEDLARHRADPFWAVWKTHVWLPVDSVRTPGLRLIHTERDPVDVAASLLQRGYPWEKIVAEVQRQAFLRMYVRHPSFRQAHHVEILSYEDTFENPGGRVRWIAAALGVDLTDEQVSRMVVETSRDRVREIQRCLQPGEQDPETLVQHRHISHTRGEPGHGRGVLGATLAHLVEAAVDFTARPDRLPEWEAFETEGA